MSSDLPLYKRLLMKISGEALCGEGNSGIRTGELEDIVARLKPVVESGVRVGLVPGGGNILRGGSFSVSTGLRRVSADYMGMLGTLINGVALRDKLEAAGIPVRLMSALRVTDVCEYYTVDKALHHLSKDRVVILTCGTGRPYFTTDTTAALRAVELGMDLFVKGTKVDGVYTADPRKDVSARRIEHLTFDEAMAGDYGIMDSTAFSLCRENRLPAAVIDFFQTDSLLKIVQGEKTGTFIGGGTDE